MQRMKKRLFAVAALILVFSLTACSGGKEENEKTAEKNEQDIKELVAYYSANKEEEDSASITSDQLIVTKEDGKKQVYDLPENEFFVSIAPYVEVTHPCANHSLTGCQGEMPDEEFEVYIEDSKGNVIVDEKMTSLENGFIDLWLPRNETFTVSIKHKKGQAEGKISTFSGDNTCITTLQLS